MDDLPTTNLELATGRAPVFDSGPGDAAEAVLFLHGNPGPMDDFAALLPEVSAFARVVALDMPNYGRASDVKLRDHQVSTYVEHLDGAIRALGLTRVHLVLHDWGGIWGLQWASEHPEAVASVTLINTGFLRGYRWHFFARIWQTPVLGELLQLSAPDAAIRHVMERDNPRPLPDAFVERSLRLATRKQRLRVTRIYRAGRDPEALADAMEPGLRKLACPVCVIWGVEDVYVPVAQAERQRELWPDAQIHLLEGLGHWPFVDDPGAVLAVLLPFLRGAVAQPQGGARPRLDAAG